MPTTMKLIAKAALTSSAALIDFDNIPGTYTDLIVYVSGRCDDATGSFAFDNAYIRFNNSTSSFSMRMLRDVDVNLSSSNSATGWIGDAPNSYATANTFGSLRVYIPNYTAATNKVYTVDAVSESTTAVGNDISNSVMSGVWANTATITRVGFSVGSPDNWVSGSSAYLYGITKA